MSEENNNTQEPAEQASSPRADEVIDVDWEQIRGIFEIKSASAQVEAHLANVLLQHAKTKANLLDRLSSMESRLYDDAFTLRNSLDIDPDLVYELKVPEKEGEKGYFIRKER